MHERLTRWFRPSTFVLAALAVLLAAVALHPMPGRLRFAIEALVYLMLALACASWLPLRRVAGQLGWVRLTVFALAFGLATWVQLRKLYGVTYPFVRWTMYAHQPRPVYIRYDVTTASGREIPFPMTQVTPGQAPRAFLSTFSYELMSSLRAAEREDGEAGESRGGAGLARFERLMGGVARVYNQRNPGDPIRKVHARICTVPIREYTGRESISCETVLTFALSPEAVK